MKKLKQYSQLVLAVFTLSFMGQAVLPAFAYDPNKPVSSTNPAPEFTSNVIPTYRASIADLSPAASATDITTLCGSATKTVSVTYVQSSSDSTAPASLDYYIYFRTASDVGGTSSVVSAANMDTSNAAPTAVVRQYTANPSSLGTGVLIVGDHYAMPAATSTGYPITQWMETFGTRNAQPVILRGTNQCIAFGFNGQAIPAGTSVYLNWEWTEQ